MQGGRALRAADGRWQMAQSTVTGATDSSLLRPNGSSPTRLVSTSHLLCTACFGRVTCGGAKATHSTAWFLGTPRSRSSNPTSNMAPERPVGRCCNRFCHTRDGAHKPERPAAAVCDHVASRNSSHYTVNRISAVKISAMADQGLPQRQAGQRRRRKQIDALGGAADQSNSFPPLVPGQVDSGRLKPGDTPAQLDELRSQAAAGHNFECED